MVNYLTWLWLIFLNKRNEADQRILELLSEKFKLFDGVFGVSDEILGRIETPTLAILGDYFSPNNLILS